MQYTSVSHDCPKCGRTVDVAKHRAEQQVDGTRLVYAHADECPGAHEKRINHEHPQTVILGANR